MKTLLLLFAAFVLIGCGSSSVVFDPDFNHPELRAARSKRDNVRIVKVTDGRSSPSSRIGTARVGMFNRQVPYVMNGDLADVVRIMLDTLIVGRHDQGRFMPINVSVDMFEVGENTKIFSEEGYFACNMRFTFPVSPDSIGEQVVFVKQTDNSAIDVTHAIEPLIYKGMAECAHAFVEGTLSGENIAMMVSSDSIESFGVQDSLYIASQNGGHTRQSKQVTVVGGNQRKSNELAFHYIRGGKIETGVRAGYFMLSQSTNSNFPWGFGICLTYYDILNTQERVKGRFVSFGGRLVGKYYFSSASTAAYIGGGLELGGGSERIDYGTSTQTNFFFGPTVDEVIGFSIDRKVSVELGTFQIAHFGSKILPSDIGFVVGLSFGI
ncbi:MAG TPA: hypothetical protein VGB89_13625 [Bacteroidota bacterium]